MLTTKYLMIQLILFILIYPNVLLGQELETKGNNLTKREEPKFGVGLSVSTFGMGPYAIYNYNSKMRLRVGTNYFLYNYSLNKILKELDGFAKLRIGGIGFFADWNFYNFLYATGGISTNFNKIYVSGKMAKSIMIGDIEMSPEDIGNVGIKITPSWVFSPYIGIGGGRKISSNKKFGYSLEVGSYFQGSPSVDLQATGMLEPTANVEQEKLIEENIKPIDFWPKI